MSELEKALNEYNQSPAVTGYDSETARKVERAKTNRSEPMPIIEGAIIRAFGDEISMAENGRTISAHELKILRTRLVNSIRIALTGHAAPTVPLIQMHAIMMFWFAMKNMPLPRIIADAFLKTEHSGMVKIYKEICDEPGVNWDMFKLLERMTEDHRGIFIAYVLNEYKGLSIETVEKFYLPKNLK